MLKTEREFKTKEVTEVIICFILVKTLESHIPITVRQLEAIIRLSEALAKMTLSNTVHVEHVREAHRLFQVA